MPEVTIKYSRDDTSIYLAALHGMDFYSVIWNLDDWLRAQIKHADKEEYQPVRDQLHDFLADKGLTLDILS